MILKIERIGSRETNRPLETEIPLFVFFLVIGSQTKRKKGKEGFRPFPRVLPLKSVFNSRPVGKCEEFPTNFVTNFCLKGMNEEKPLSSALISPNDLVGKSKS